MEEDFEGRAPGQHDRWAKYVLAVNLLGILAIILLLPAVF